MTCPSHVDEEFRADFQFLDLGEHQKINKKIFKDSVIRLAASFFSLVFHPLLSPTLSVTAERCFSYLLKKAFLQAKEKMWF